ncbi:MAG: hypothetical protein J5817_04975 [Treponema sp.]|nr:hypothetical protein [Treponema sp.]
MYSKVNVLAALAFSALLCLLSVSCSANDDAGSLTIVMPGSSSSRSITSENPNGLGFDSESVGIDSFTFSVYIRDADNNEVEKYTGIAPGAKLTIDQLRAGTYNIAIRCLNASGGVSYYGAAQADVKGGTENSVSIRMQNAGSYHLCLLFKNLLFGLSLSSGNTINGKLTCNKNGDSYTFTGTIDNDTYGEFVGEYPCLYENDKFCEPGLPIQ